MTTSTAAKWSERVREWRASGKTAEEFASAFEFEASTLRYWASRLKTEAAGVAVPTIARVVRRRAQPSASLPGLREFSARILVRPGFDAELLRQVAAALGSLR
jgi:hypothetical protein